LWGGLADPAPIEWALTAASGRAVAPLAAAGSAERKCLIVTDGGEGNLADPCRLVRQVKEF
jgi:hypothetical protein